MAVFTAGDELLHAIDDVLITFFGGRGAQGRRVRAHVRLGQTEGAKHVALCELGEPLLLLRIVAVAHEDGIHRTVGHANRRAGATIACGDFF